MHSLHKTGPIHIQSWLGDLIKRPYLSHDTIAYWCFQRKEELIVFSVILTGPVLENSSILMDWLNSQVTKQKNNKIKVGKDF